MLNEYVLKFKCKKCKTNKLQIMPCSGDLNVMKAGLKKPGKCKKCDKSDWEIWGILNIDAEDIN